MIYMWFGSEVYIFNMNFIYMDKYNGKEKLFKKVDWVFEFLDMLDDECL